MHFQIEEEKRILIEEKEKLESQPSADHLENNEVLQAKLTEVEQQLAKSTEVRMRVQAELSKTTEDIKNLNKLNNELQMKINSDESELMGANVALRAEAESQSKRAEDLQVSTKLFHPLAILVDPSRLATCPV